MHYALFDIDIDIDIDFDFDTGIMNTDKVLFCIKIKMVIIG